MIAPKDRPSGSRRAIGVLCVTQILGWATLFYPPALTMGLVAAAHGWSLAQTISGFSVALVMSGLMAPTACGLIDRHGGHLVMSSGALIGACGLAIIPLASNFAIYLAAWLLIGIAMASILYDPAFTTLTRIFGAAARRPITLVTFAGGFASTVGWPATHLLIENAGWRGAYLAFAAVLALIVAPLHAFALPRGAKPVTVPVPEPAAGGPVIPPPKTIAPAGFPFMLIAAAFAGHAFVLSGMSTHLLPILQRGGLDAGTVVMIGALFGPAQVMSRVMDFVTGSRTDPLWVARGSMALMAVAFALFLIAGFSTAIAAVFAIVFGAANGVMTIARGALPLTMFGPLGYGRVIGRIARPAQIMQAAAPFALAVVIERWSDRGALAVTMTVVLIALGCFMAIRRPA